MINLPLVFLSRNLINYNLSNAGIAQLVVQLIRNQQVDGSSPFPGFLFPP